MLFVLMLVNGFFAMSEIAVVSAQDAPPASGAAGRGAAGVAPIPYDPTNGTISRGDLFISVPQE